MKNHPWRKQKADKKANNPEHRKIKHNDTVPTNRGHREKNLCETNQAKSRKNYRNQTKHACTNQTKIHLIGLKPKNRKYNP